METLAEYIAAYALPVVVGLVIAVAGGVALAWRWVAQNGPWLRRALWALWQRIGGDQLATSLRHRYPRLWHFLHRRMSPVAYLGLYFTLGLVLLTGCLAVFGELIEDLWEEEEVARFDRALVDALQERTSAVALHVFAALTRLGDVSTVTTLGFLVGLMLLVRRHWLTCVAWAVTLLGGGLLNTLLKELIRRDRPEVAEPFLAASGWSFPSAHAMGAAMAYGMLAYLVLRQGNPRWRLPVIVFTVTLVLLVGASRIVLQVHYFSDVVAGIAAGIAWLVICITGSELALRRAERR